MAHPISRPRTPWLSLGEASSLLGITPATLRRWADQGDVATFVTPGGHRPFPRSAIEALVPRARPGRPLSGMGVSASRVARAYRRSRPPARASSAAGLSSLSESERVEFKGRGHTLLALLLDHLDGGDREKSTEKLEEAVAAAAERPRAPWTFCWSR